MAEERDNGRAFRGSDTTRASVGIYQQDSSTGAGDVDTFESPYKFVDRVGVVGVDVDLALGGGGGFSVALKASLPRRQAGLETRYREDDWVDIVFTREGEPSHVLRGMIDVPAAVSGTNAKTTVVSGRTFRKPLEITPIFYDPWSDGEVEGGAVTRIFDIHRAFLGPPDVVLDALIFGFLADLGARGRANWTLPSGMVSRAATPALWSKIASPSAGTLSAPTLKIPARVGLRPDDPLVGPIVLSNPETIEELTQRFGRGAAARELLKTSQRFVHPLAYVKDFSNDPERGGVINPLTLNPYNQYVWSLAQEWSDAPICELFTDLVDGSGALLDPDGTSRATSTPGETRMAVVFRDRPFPTTSRAGESIDQGPWSRLPTAVVDWRDIGDGRALARSGAERFNAFLLAPKLFQELIGVAHQLNRPLWDPDDIVVHGLRKMDVTANYTSTSVPNALGIANTYRERLRDIHCLNHEFFSGSLPLIRCRPDIRPGMKLVVTNYHGQGGIACFYIEAVSHRWRYKAGGQTTLGVTRGVIGGDDALYQAILDAQKRYDLPAPRVV